MHIREWFLAITVGLGLICVCFAYFYASAGQAYVLSRLSRLLSVPCQIYTVSQKTGPFFI